MSNSSASIIQQSNAAWESLATWWDAAIDEGDPYHRTLIFPTILKWVEAQNPKRILDFACGNGALARRMAKVTSADIVATDVSEMFIQKANARTTEPRIQYSVVDATEAKALHNLTHQGPFDVVVCSMALHDIPTLEPFLSVLPILLTPKGCFIFSIPHPCFNSGDIQLDLNSEQPSVKRSTYIKPLHSEIKSKPGQPINQHMFHRSITELFSLLFAKGMVLDGLVEPAVCDVKEPVEYAWKHLPEVPPALIGRWRKE